MKAHNTHLADKFITGATGHITSIYYLVISRTCLIEILLSSSETPFEKTNCHAAKMHGNAEDWNKVLDVAL